MRPSMFMGAAGLAPASYIGSGVGTISSSAPTVNLAAIPGIALGDYVFVICVTNEGSYFSAVGWNEDNFTFGSGYKTTVLHRKITSLSLSVSTAAASPCGVMVAVYRGASRAARASAVNVGSGPSSIVIPGTTRQPDCVGMLTLAESRSAGQTTCSPSAGFTRRAIGSPGLFTQTFADALPRSSYVDGVDVVWSNIGDFRTGMLFEMRL